MNFFPQITKAKSTFREHCIGIGALQLICMSEEDTKVLLTFVLWAAARVGETEKSSVRGSGKKNEEQNCKKEVEERCLCWLTLCYWFLSALKKLIGGEQIGRSKGREKRWILAILLPLLLHSYYSGLEMAELIESHMRSDLSFREPEPM